MRAHRNGSLTLCAGAGEAPKPRGRRVVFVNVRGPMTPIHPLTAAGVCLAAFMSASTPAAAQVQLNVCGVPPLPPCERPRVRERIVEPDDDLGTLCRTRTLRCQVARPRPIGARSTCEDDEGEEILGRIVR